MHCVVEFWLYLASDIRFFFIQNEKLTITSYI